MSTNFPTSLQDLDATRGTTGQPLNNPNHITHHNTEDDTVEALQAKVGIDSSAVITSHDYKLSEVTSTDKAVGKTATQTLTGKTISGASNTLTVREADLSIADNTTKDVSISAHGFAPKAPNDATKYLDGTGAYSVPAAPLAAGIIHQYGGSSAPSGYLLCDGTAVSRATYAGLFTAISTTYGVGDGSTTFNVPNLKGKVPVGYNASETEFDALGETGGEKTHTLTEAEMPTHSHSIPTYGGGATNNWLLESKGENVTTSRNTNSAGSGSAHQNLQPYLTLNFIIKT